MFEYFSLFFRKWSYTCFRFLKFAFRSIY